MKDSENIRILLSRVAENDNVAFRNFYDIFYIHIYRFSGYFVKNEDVKEEIVSDVFLSIWQSRKNLTRIDDIKAYLYITTRNRALFYIKNSNPDNLITLEQLPIGFAAHYETPENIVITEELVKAIQIAIEELPERCKLVFLMAKEEGLKYKEIAQILSISEKTVNAQIVTALKKLSETLQKFMQFLFTVF